MGSKKCTKCGEEKDLDEFHTSKHGTHKLGRLPRCKECRKEDYIKNDAPRSKTPKYKFKRYKRKATEKGLLFELDFKLFENLISSPCEYCGGKGFGVDRVDSSEGYTISNCVSCCTKCNLMKFDYTMEEFKEQLIKIVKHNFLLAFREDGESLYFYGVKD